MVIMAGMLPGVECARRRRLRQSSSSEEEAGAARRPSLCLYAGGGRGRVRSDLGSSTSSSLSSAASSKDWSSACGVTTTTTATATLGTDAREAKQRLDHKLRGQRQPVVVLHQRHETSTRPSPANPRDDAACNGTGGDHHRLHSATATATPAPCAGGALLQREVLLPSSSSSSRPKLSWCRRLAGVVRRRGPPPTETETETEECAVCLEDLRAGDVVARLPCAHRFHWPCALPWLQAVSRCPVCRAHVAATGPTTS